ncbi:MAG: cell division ATP-binding protein FtsE [Clostridia bacterium]|nr:cell division ATP-binding protein FtsE [Clostridia bacterium]
MIHLRQVTKVYRNDVTALRDVDLDVQRGEFVYLVGPSGAGKSTLVKLLYREELATSGEVWVNGVELTRMRRRDVPYFRRRIGVVFQDFRLLPNKTVFDNVAFALVVTEASPREIRRRVPAVLEMVGLLDRARAYPQELSGGEQQRVALARAVVNNPVLVIADEPTGNLDPITARGIMELLAEVNRRGTTVVMATHAEFIVNSMRRRVVALRDGCVTRDEERGRYAIEG